MLEKKIIRDTWDKIMYITAYCVPPIYRIEKNDYYGGSWSGVPFE